MKDLAKQIIQKEAERRWQLLSTEGAHHDQGTMAYRIKAHNSMAEQGRKQFIDSHQWLIDALPESEWVSVEDGLPEDADEYDVTFELPIGRQAVIVMCFDPEDIDDNDNPIWRKPHGEWQKWEIPTHWRNRPQPPKSK